MRRDETGTGCARTPTVRRVSARQDRPAQCVSERIGTERINGVLRRWLTEASPAPGVKLSVIEENQFDLNRMLRELAAMDPGGFTARLRKVPKQEGL